MDRKKMENYLNTVSKLLNESENEKEIVNPEEGGLDELLDDVEIEDISDEGDCAFPCPVCDGDGEILDEDGESVSCDECGGTGEVCEDDAVYDFDPEIGTCPNCGANLNVIEPEEDSLVELDDEFDDDFDDEFDDDFDDELDY